MKKERLKNIVLTLLIISSVVLALNIWVDGKLWSDDYNFFSSITEKIVNVFSNKTDNSGSLSKEKLALPKSLIINNPPKRGIYYESSFEYDEMIDDVKEILIKALESKNFVNVNEDDWNNAIQSKAIYISYPVVYDVDIITDILGIDRTNLDFKTVKTFVIAKGNQIQSELVVYIKDSSGESYKKCVIKHDNKSFDAILGKYAINSSGLLPFSFELNFDKRADDASHQKVTIEPDVSLSITNTFSECISSLNPLFNSETGQFNTEKTDAILRVFDFNLSTARKSREADGSIVYVENYGTIKIFPSGLVEYKAISSDKGIELTSSRNLSFNKMFTSTLNFVTDLWNSVIPESEINLGISSDIVDDNQKIFSMEMNYYHNGILIRDDIEKTNLHDGIENAVEIKVKDGRIVWYRQNFKTYLSENEMIETGSTIDALDKLFNDTSFKENDRIKDIYPAYTFENGRCRMSWVIKSKNGATALLK